MGKVQMTYEGKVAVLRLNHGVTNGLDSEVIAEAGECLEQVREKAGAMVLAGGEKVFCMGLHLPSVMEFDRPQLLEYYQNFNQLCLDLYTMPMPTAAAIVGHAPAGGCVIATTCDYRLIAENRPKIGLNEIHLGVALPYLASLILIRLLGDKKAREMTDIGELYSPEEALALGLVDEVHPAEEVEAKAIEKMAEFCNFSGQALAANKACRVEAVKEQYEAVGRQINEKVLDYWFDDKVREILALAATRF